MCVCVSKFSNTTKVSQKDISRLFSIDLDIMKTSTAPLRHSPAAMHTAIGVLIQSHIIIDAVSFFLVSEFERGLKAPLVMTYVHAMQTDREQTNLN